VWAVDHCVEHAAEAEATARYGVGARDATSAVHAPKDADDLRLCRAHGLSVIFDDLERSQRLREWSAERFFHIGF
jgi:hypothetical protein